MKIDIDTEIASIDELKRIFEIIQKEIIKKENKNSGILSKIARSNYGLKNKTKSL